MSALRRSQPKTQNWVRAVVRDGHIVLLKTCQGCDREMVASEGPDSAFLVHSRYKGKAIYHPRCRKCMARARKERMRDPEHREHRRAYQREYARQRRRDPEKWQQERELDRIRAVAKAEEEGRTIRHIRGTVIDGTAPRLPAAPFRAWLRAYQMATGLRGNEDTAKELGIEPKRVSVVMAGQRHVALDVVDRAILNAKVPVRVDGREILLLQDLYPA